MLIDSIGNRSSKNASHVPRLDQSNVVPGWNGTSTHSSTVSKLNSVKKMQNKGYCAIQGHRGQYNRKPVCDFLLVINSK